MAAQFDRALRDLLRAAGCTQVQGFFFNRPVPACELDFDADAGARAIGEVA